jgi:hypothetical protein
MCTTSWCGGWRRGLDDQVIVRSAVLSRRSNDEPSADAPLRSYQSRTCLFEESSTRSATRQDRNSRRCLYSDSVTSPRTYSSSSSDGTPSLQRMR